MKTIEITTPQNVTIEYELATLQDRCFAFLIDAVLLIMGFSFFISGLQFLIPEEIVQNILYIIVVPVVVFYSLVLEALNGGSVGKMAMKLRVVRSDGSVPEFSDLTLRWVFRMVDIYLSLGALAMLFVSSTRKGQRLGDMVANTVLIRFKPSRELRLNDILSISSLQTYTPLYPEARKLTTEDILLIKSVLERVKKFSNPAHQEAVDLLADKLLQLLAIPERPRDNIQFLRTLMKDYVVLTR
jgi:uncharacterized RDD family membrane protein YckC